MSNALQDQLLKAGLASKQQAKKANKEKQKKNKQNRKSKTHSIDESKLLAQKAHQEKVENDRKLNQLKEDKARQKAIGAQIAQLIDSNKVNISDGDVSYNFQHDSAIKKLFIDSKIQQQIANGSLAITFFNNSYAIVPKPVAEKIQMRDESYIVVLNEKTSENSDETDEYADYQIPDDLMW